MTSGEIPDGWMTCRGAPKSARRILALLSPVLAVLGVRHDTVRDLLTLRLLIDRGRSGAEAGPQRRNQRLLGGFLALLGTALGLAAFEMTTSFEWTLLTQTAGFGLVLLIGMPLVAGLYTDRTDLQVVATLPVKDRSLLCARLAHLCLVVAGPLAWFTVPVALLGSLASSSPWCLALVPLASVSTAGTALGLAAGLHGLTQALRGSQRRHQTAVWTTTLLALSAAAGLALGFRHPVGLDELSRAAWLWWFPPAHAASLAAFDPGRVATTSAAGLGAPGVALALVLPLLAVVVVIGAHRRARLTLDAPQPQGRERRGAAWPELPWWARRLRVAPTAHERAGFGLGWALCVRDTVFLQAVLPALSILVLSGLFQLTAAATVGGASLVVLVAYLAALSIGLLAEGSSRGLDPGATWIYAVAPLTRPGLLIRGCLVAILTRLYGSVVILFGLATVVTHDVGLLPQVMLALGLGSALAVVSLAWMPLRLPFSRPIADPAARRLETFGLHMATGALLFLTGLAHGELLGQRQGPWVLGLALVSAAAGVRWAGQRVAGRRHVDGC